MVTGESEAHFWQETRRCSHLPVKQQFGKLRKVGRIRFLSSFYKFLLCSQLSYREPQWLLRKWGNNHLVLSVLKPFKNNVLPLVYLLEPVKILLFKMLYRRLPWLSSGSDLAFQCRGCRFNPHSGSYDATCFMAKKPKHKTEAVL